jgi:hypothetical protein
VSVLRSAATESNASPAQRAEQLAAVLAAMGLPVEVEPRATLAVIVASQPAMTRLTDATLRRAVLAAAREHGFTHVALELGDN